MKKKKAPPEMMTPLDELIFAFDQGDGATLQARRLEIRERLVELRRYRNSLRDPTCGECAS